VVDCPWFTTGIISLDELVEKDFNFIDSFVVYLCVEGLVEIGYGNGGTEAIGKGETVLVPASLKNIHILPQKPSRLLEIFIK
jgi:mannose-6-phosphate isomerase